MNTDMTPQAVRDLIDDLNDLKLVNMASALDAVYHSPEFDTLGKISFLQKVIEPECTAKKDNRYARNLAKANLKGCPQLFSNCHDSKERSYLPNGITETLGSLGFIEEGLNVCILGPSDSGKSYLAKAIGIKACIKHKVAYYHSEPFLEEMVAIKEENYKKYQKRIRAHLKLDLLILDDFLIHTITDEREIKILFELLEKRCELSRSTVVCSQREPNSWASMILNDEVSSNSIMKRVTKHYTVLIKPEG